MASYRCSEVSTDRDKKDVDCILHGGPAILLRLEPNQEVDARLADKGHIVCDLSD
jgi:hypothetical protein